MEKYPSPAHAGTIWLAGDQLFLSMPGHEDHIRHHAVQFTVDRAALKSVGTDMDVPFEARKSVLACLALMNILHERALANHPQKIGLQGAPTQYDLDHIIKSFGGQIKNVNPPKPISDDITLEDLGL